MVGSMDHEAPLLRSGESRVLPVLATILANWTNLNGGALGIEIEARTN